MTATAASARPRRGERVVASFEAAKGVLVLLVGLGLLSVVHEDLQRAAEQLVGHFHLNPASRYPRVFVALARDFSDLRTWLLAAAAFAYAGLRLAEAWGLWHGRRWAEWFAAASGAVYVPIEVGELVAGVSWLKVATLAANVAIVAYMSRTLWRAARAGPAGGDCAAECGAGVNPSRRAGAGSGTRRRRGSRRRGRRPRARRRSRAGTCR